jgi:inosose dehydratase
VSWGIWEQTIERDDLVPPRPLLETVTSMGYRALETGPPGYLAADGAAALGLIEPFAVRLVATFLPLRLDDGDAFAHDLGALDQTTEVLSATGGGIVLLADAERPERAAVSGQPEKMAQTALSSDALDRAAERLDEAAARCADRGLRAAFHPHAATYLESAEEVEAILSRTEIALCIDTGHTIVGGGDPVELVRRHGARLAHVHLKDVDGSLLEQLRDGAIDMNEAWAQGIFCPFGEGVVDLGGFLAEPAVRNLAGYAVLEQDRMAVTVEDLPAVRAVEEQNLARVREWLT